MAAGAAATAPRQFEVVPLPVARESRDDEAVPSPVIGGSPMARRNSWLNGGLGGNCVTPGGSFPASSGLLLYSDLFPAGSRLSMTSLESLSPPEFLGNWP